MDRHKHLVKSVSHNGPLAPARRLQRMQRERLMQLRRPGRIDNRARQVRPRRVI